MAATKSQGRAFTLFMAGLTAATAGIAFFSSGSGKVAFVLGAVVVAVSFSDLLENQAAGRQGRARRATSGYEA